MNQTTADKKDRNGGGDVTKADEVDTPVEQQKMVVRPLGSTGDTRFTEE